MKPATVRCAGGVAASEVLPADAANLPPIVSDRAGEGEGRCPISVVRGDVLKTTRERAEEKRLAKLALVREQVQSGSLVIRQMTAEERRRYAPRPVRPYKRGKQ
jgi:hypothetical protein